MFATPKITERGANIHVSYGDDNGLYPVFSVEAVKDEEASVEAGREIFKDVEWVTIHIVGDTKTEVSRPVTEQDKQRFERQYEAFKKQGVTLHEGTPLTEWTLVTKAMALNLKSMNIHTVEQLAACADGNLGFMGGRELQKKAVAWLEQAKENAGLSKMQAENEQLKRDLEAMKQQFTEQLKALEKKKGKKDEDIS